MSTACCPSSPVVLRPPRPQRWLGPLQRAWAVWRAQSERRAEMHALDQLSDSVRRDIGLAERAPPASSSPVWSHERGLW